MKHFTVYGGIYIYPFTISYCFLRSTALTDTPTYLHVPPRLKQREWHHLKSTLSCIFTLQSNAFVNYDLAEKNYRPQAIQAVRICHVKQTSCWSVCDLTHHTVTHNRSQLLSMKMLLLYIQFVLTKQYSTAHSDSQSCSQSDNLYVSEQIEYSSLHLVRSGKTVQYCTFRQSDNIQSVVLNLFE